jgi:hypothetical protein
MTIYRGEYVREHRRIVCYTSAKTSMHNILAGIPNVMTMQVITETECFFQKCLCPTYIVIAMTSIKIRLIPKYIVLFITLVHHQQTVQVSRYVIPSNCPKTSLKSFMQERHVRYYFNITFKLLNRQPNIMPFLRSNF